MHYYTTYGLIVASELQLPELLPSSATATPDVEIRLGSVPAHLDNPRKSPFRSGVLYEATSTQFLLKVDHIARYLVSCGNQIVIDQLVEVPLSELRIFLLGSCIGALLHQRGILALHASAIVVNNNAVLFAGHSGAGKSTLLNAFLQRGYQMLTDDVAGVYLDEGGIPYVLPGIPRTKLWIDAAEKLDKNLQGLERTRPNLDKFELPTFNHFRVKSAPFKLIYELGTHSDLEIRLTPADMRQSFQIFAQQTYRRRYLDAIQHRGQHLAQTTKIIQKVRTCRVQRPEHLYRLQALADAIEADFKMRLD